MKKWAYYNEHDAYAAQWIRNLIKAGLVSPGEVDERDIQDVSPDDVRSFVQCHWFAGIAGWSYALRLAGWPDTEPVFTGSCPCQPLSSAGQRKGHADERHLWPAFHALIAECRPATVFGEQVASKDGREWLAGVRADLESAGYAVGAADLCAAGVGAPHIRQRLFWLADADGRHASAEGLQRGGKHRQRPEDGRADRLAVTEGEQFDGGRNAGRGRRQSTNGRDPWSCDWLPCTDGKARPVEPGTFPLLDGLSFKLGSGSPFEGKSRVGMLRAYGNAIVPQVAAAFITAAMEATDAANV